MSATLLTCSVVFATKSSSPFRRVGACGTAWIFAIVSLLLVSMQSAVLGLVIFESSHPTCASHTDCKQGTVCSVDQKETLDTSENTPIRKHDYGYDAGRWFNQLNTPKDDASARCHDCHYEFKRYYETAEGGDAYTVSMRKRYCNALLNTRSSPLYLYQQPWDTSIDSSKLAWINGPGAAPVRLDHNSSDWKHPTRVNFTYAADLMCFRFQHCLMTDMMPQRCDFLVLDSARLHWTHYWLLYGLSMFVWAVLSRDMDRALEEERFLLKKHEEAMIEHANKDHISQKGIAIAVQVLRACLRARRFSIPVLLANTSATMILYGGISAANIVLNVLAVVFLLDADAYAATLFLPSEFLFETKKAIVEFRKEQIQEEQIQEEQIETPRKPLSVSVDCTGTIGKFGARVCSFCCTVLLCVTVMHIEDLIHTFGVEEGALCSDVTDTLGVTLYICIGVLIGIHFVLFLVASKLWMKLAVKQVIISAFDELFASGAGVAAFSCTYGFFLYMGSNRAPSDYWWIFIISFCGFLILASMMGIVTFYRVQQWRKANSDTNGDAPRGDGDVDDEVCT